MNFKVEKTWNGIAIELTSVGRKTGQLFYGPVHRGLDYMEGHYDTADLWPENKNTWEQKHIDSFIEYHENSSFLGIYILWFIVHLPIVAPKVETNGNPWISFKKNIRVDAHEITVIPKYSECEDEDKIIFELSKALENFNVNDVFQEMVEAYKALHTRTFGEEANKKLLGFLPNIFYKKEETKHYPCWRNKSEGSRKSWSVRQALNVFTKQFEENKLSYYEELV